MGIFIEKNKKHLLFAGLLTGTFLIFKYIFPLILPFIPAVFLVVLIYPQVEKIHRRTHMGRGFLGGFFLLIIFSIMGTVVWYGITWAIHKICEIIKKMDYYQMLFGSFIRDCSEMIEGKIGIRADEIEMIILERVNIIAEDVQLKIMPNLMNQSLFYIKVFVAVVTFIVVMIIAAILLIKDFETIKDKAVSLKGYREVVCFIKKVSALVLSYMKAQIIILLVVVLICIAGFYLAGNKSFIWLGIVTGLLDVLPLVGTGIVLLPYMLFQFMKGEVLKGVILLVTFCVSALARELLEPKLIGKKMNVLPVLILVSIYAGVQVFGFAGVILGPLYLLVINEGLERIY